MLHGTRAARTFSKSKVGVICTELGRARVNSLRAHYVSLDYRVLIRGVDSRVIRL